MAVNNLHPENFDEHVIATDKFVVVTFYADWCGPCRDFTPSLYSLSKAIPTITVARVNVDACPKLSKRFDINGIPNTLIFKKGKQIDQLVGNIPYDHLMKVILKHLSKEQPSESPDEGSPKTDEKKSDKPSGLANLLQAVRQLFRDAFNHLTKNK